MTFVLFLVSFYWILPITEPDFAVLRYFNLLRFFRLLRLFADMKSVFPILSSPFQNGHIDTSLRGFRRQVFPGHDGLLHSDDSAVGKCFVYSVPLPDFIRCSRSPGDADSRHQLFHLLTLRVCLCQLFGGLVFDGNPALDGSDYVDNNHSVYNHNDMWQAFITLFSTIVVTYITDFVSGYAAVSSWSLSLVYWISFTLIVNYIVFNVFTSLMLDIFQDRMEKSNLLSGQTDLLSGQTDTRCNFGPNFDWCNKNQCTQPLEDSGRPGSPASPGTPDGAGIEMNRGSFSRSSFGMSRRGSGMEDSDTSSSDDEGRRERQELKKRLRDKLVRHALTGEQEIDEISVDSDSDYDIMADYDDEGDEGEDDEGEGDVEEWHSDDSSDQEGEGQ